jgi:hypothetical protein
VFSAAAVRAREGEDRRGDAVDAFDGGLRPQDRRPRERRVVGMPQRQVGAQTHRRERVRHLMADHGEGFAEGRQFEQPPVRRGVI